MKETIEDLAVLVEKAKKLDSEWDPTVMELEDMLVIKPVLALAGKLEERKRKKDLEQKEAAIKCFKVLTTLAGAEASAHGLPQATASSSLLMVVSLPLRTGFHDVDDNSFTTQISPTAKRGRPEKVRK
ncbi:hypothetical protein K505DRAFT_358276 [Melanomma pulvis-pyrius CBS 109.77]|uniref:Uncharacterized protein n=1 Tax=Melanomma pulvis-pyrius CBS 109.77 TaxID=1314802 RepID=A0A6A6XPX3_9PLEO|nr:hypothetical protein K505DRAFT_358276 [Melanomma pulvis-pyrius CBS 109.77]